MDSRELPPCEDSLFMRVLCANRLQFGGGACKGGYLCQVQKELMDHR